MNIIVGVEEGVHVHLVDFLLAPVLINSLKCHEHIFPYNLDQNYPLEQLCLSFKHISTRYQDKNAKKIVVSTTLVT